VGSDQLCGEPLSVLTHIDSNHPDGFGLLRRIRNFSFLPAVLLKRLNPDGTHHAPVFVLQNVAMKGKCAHDVRIPKINPQPDARIGARKSVRCAAAVAEPQSPNAWRIAGKD
jgi:hypothetical protein